MFLNTVYQLRRGWRFQWEPVQACHVILYPEGMVKLSPTAGAILEQVNGMQSVQQIIDMLCQQYPEADPATLSDDVEVFIAEAKFNGWLQIKEVLHANT